MKLRRAIEILMQAAKRDIEGAGTGISSLPSEKMQEEVREALKRCHKYVYGFEKPYLHMWD